MLLTIEHGPEGNKFPADYISLAFYYCDTPPKANNLPSAELLKKVNPPKMQEYWIQLLPVKKEMERYAPEHIFIEKEYICESQFLHAYNAAQLWRHL